MARSTVRVVPTRADLAKRGLVALLAVALVLLLLALRSAGVIGGPDAISADLANAGGSLAKGADVKMRGVIVGKVAGIARGPQGGVRVTLDMFDGDLGHIPDNVVARILPATVFGTSFVDLTVHGPAAPQSLRAGAIVPADKTQGTLELQQALDDIDSLVKALDPARLNVTLGAAATALDGRGAEIGTLIDQLDSFLRKLQPEIPLVRSDVTKLGSNLDLLRDAAPDLLDSVAQSLSTLHTISAQKAAITTLLTGGTALLQEGDRFLAAQSPRLVTFLRNAAQVTDIYYDLRHQAFTESFATLRMVAAKLGSTIHDGWLDNTVVIEGKTPPYYTSADCPTFGSARGDNCASLGKASISSMLGDR